MLAGLIYFLMVFAAGFVLGVIRVLVMVPRFGEAASELIELPFMVLISYFAAGFLVRRFDIETIGSAIATGLTALGLLILLELTLVLGLRGLTFSEYIASRDPVSFTAYLASLLTFAALPAMLARRSN